MRFLNSLLSQLRRCLRDILQVQVFIRARSWRCFFPPGVASRKKLQPYKSLDIAKNLSNQTLALRQLAFGVNLGIYLRETQGLRVARNAHIDDPWNPVGFQTARHFFRRANPWTMAWAWWLVPSSPPRRTENGGIWRGRIFTNHWVVVTTDLELRNSRNYGFDQSMVWLNGCTAIFCIFFWKLKTKQFVAGP